MGDAGLSLKAISLFPSPLPTCRAATQQETAQMRRGATEVTVEAPSHPGSPPTLPRGGLAFDFLMTPLGLPYHSDASSSGGQQARCLSEVLRHGQGTRGPQPQNLTPWPEQLAPPVF